MVGNSTAKYKVISEKSGNIYQFFCDLSGALCCTTKPIKAENADEELQIAWINEGRKMFNKCSNCGKWVNDIVFNPDTLQCVACSPWEITGDSQSEQSSIKILSEFGFGPEEMKKYVVCENCGQLLRSEYNFLNCPNCGEDVTQENLYQIYLKNHIKV